MRVEVPSTGLVRALLKDFNHSSSKSVVNVKRHLSSVKNRQCVFDVVGGLLKAWKQESPTARSLFNLNATVKCKGRHSAELGHNDIVSIHKHCTVEKGCREMTCYKVRGDVQILVLALRSPPTLHRPESPEEAVKSHIPKRVTSDFALVSVISHETDRSFDHFTCLRKDLADVWWYCSDESVQRFDVVNRHSDTFENWRPHILFYVRRN